MKLGDKIKTIRIQKKISQKDFAKLLEIPISTLANYENNHREPKIETLNKIANALGVSINDLYGNKKTFTQETIKLLIETGLTLEQIAKEADIPFDELNNMFNNKSFNLGDWQKFLKYIGATDEQIADIFIQDIFINSVYNNNGNDKQADALKKMFLGETLTLDEVLMNAADEDKDFLTQMYYAGALNTNGILDKKKKNNFSFTLDDKVNPSSIETFLNFLEKEDVNLDTLSKENIIDLYNKVHDLIEFELFKIKKQS